MLADVQIARSVIRHAVAFIAGFPDFFDAVGGAPAAPHVAGHVAEVQALFLRIPDGSFRKPEARAEFFDRRILINQLEHLRRFDFDGFAGIIHSVFTPPESPRSSAGRMRQAVFSQNSNCKSIFAQNYILGVRSCQTRIARD